MALLKNDSLFHPTMISLIEKYFGLVLILFLVMAVFIPEPGIQMQSLLPVILVIILTLTFIKVDILQVVKHASKPSLMLYVAVVFMVIIPILVFLVSYRFDYSLAVGLLLLACMPPGVAAAAITDIFGGNTALSLSLTILLYFIAPISVPLMFYFTISSSIQLDLLALTKLLFILIALPVALSQTIKYFFSRYINQSIRYISSVNILLIASLGYIGFAPHSHIIQSDLGLFLYTTFWLILMFLAFFTIGIVMMWRSSRKNKIAISVSKTYMNNALAIVIASQYFDSHVVLIAVLSSIPWNFTPGIFKKLTTKFLN